MSNDTFAQSVYRVVRTIPRGKLMTYAQVAKKIGKPKAYRAVANALNKNYDPAIPCHRVIRSDSALGGYNRGPVAKKRLLTQEGAI